MCAHTHTHPWDTGGSGVGVERGEEGPTQDAGSRSGGPPREQARGGEIGGRLWRNGVPGIGLQQGSQAGSS